MRRRTKAEPTHAPNPARTIAAASFTTVEFVDALRDKYPERLSFPAGLHTVYSKVDFAGVLTVIVQDES